jgi:hypothetical protein
VRGGDLDSTCAKSHVDDDLVRDDGQPPRDKWMNYVFAMQVLSNI